MMMNSIAAELEKQHKEKSMRTSLVIHILILLLAWLLVLPASPKKPEKENFAVAVEFVDFKESSLSQVAHDDRGTKRPKQEKVQKIETPKVEKIDVKVNKPVEIPKPEPVLEAEAIDAIVSEILEEESELQAIEEEMEVEEAEPEVVEPELEPEEEVVFEEVAEEAVEEAVEEASAPVSEEVSEADDAAGAPSSLDGEEGGTGKGNEGDGAGSSSGNDGDEGMGEEGTGTGEYDGSGDGVFGRKVIYRNIAAVIDAVKESGRVVAKVCINPRGYVSYVELDDFETTITDPRALRSILEAFREYKYEPDRSAPDEQCGRLAVSSKVDLNKERNAFVAKASSDIARAKKGGAELNRFKRKYKGLTPTQVKNLSVNEFKKLFKK